jgi:hypothetical protein
LINFLIIGWVYLCRMFYVLLINEQVPWRRWENRLSSLNLYIWVSPLLGMFCVHSRYNHLMSSCCSYEMQCGYISFCSWKHWVSEAL